jgi:hypothetical protein
VSRSGYSYDNEYAAVWRGRVMSATRGKRGQAFFRSLIVALDAMPEKRLIVNELEAEGEVCAIGALGRARGIDMSSIDPECPEQVAPLFDIAECLAQEVVYMNDEDGHHAETPEQRWTRMRKWVARQIRVTPEEAGAVEVESTAQGESDG